MTNKPTRLDKRTLIIFASVLGVEAVVCAGLVMSVHNRKSALEQTLAQKESALSRVRTVSAGLPGLEAQYAKMLSQIRILERTLPPPEYIPTLLGDVERTAKASGVLIQEFRPKTAAPNADPAAASTPASSGETTQKHFDMTVTGNYRQVQTFLQNLTKFRKVLALNSIKLQPAAGGKVGVSPNLTGTLSLTAFVLPPGPAGIDGPAPTVEAAEQPMQRVAPPPAAAATAAARKVAASKGLVPAQTATRS